MRRSVYPLLFSTIVVLAWAAPVAAHPGDHGHRGLRALHRAHHIDMRLDRRAAHAAALGHPRRALALDRRGDRLVERVERRVHRAHHRQAARFPRG